MCKVYLIGLLVMIYIWALFRSPQKPRNTNVMTLKMTYVIVWVIYTPLCNSPYFKQWKLSGCRKVQWNFSPPDGLRAAQIWDKAFGYQRRSTFKLRASQINIMFLYFEAEERMGDGGRKKLGRQTACVLIPDIYLCLFLLGSRLRGSNSCRGATEQQSLWSSLWRKTQCPARRSPCQQGIGGPGDWRGVVLVVVVV